MPKLKHKPRSLEEHSDAEVLTLIAWAGTRINVLKQEIELARTDIKKWRKEMRRRKGK